MKKVLNILHSYRVLIGYACLLTYTIMSAQPLPAPAHEAGINSINEKVVSFYYDNEDLVDVINSLASLKDVNVVLPVGPNAIVSKLTVHVEDKLTVEQAWDLLYTVLDVAGYSMVERERNTFAVIRTNKEIVKAALPVYINVAPEKLPDSDERIRFLYFLSNIKISEEAEGELQSLLKDLLPPEVALYRVEPASNALIITATAKEIKSVMRIVQLLEKTTYKEKMELVKLQYVSASVVANIFNESILKTPAERQRYGVDTKKPSETTYFSRFVKIIPDDRINALIVVGREQAVDRVKDFVRKYIDTPLDSGQSILHVYELQYLDAFEFAEVLQKIVEAATAAGTGQAQAEPGKQVGVERYFEGVIVRADRPKEEAEGVTARGGNKLIVAARNEDWRRIEELIQKLDVPQPQVIIQVLVADLTLNDVRLIGTLLRNAAKLGLPQGVDFQAANIGNIIVDDYDKPTTLAADLLRKYYRDGKPAEDGNQSFADIADANSTLVAFNDCSNCWTWAILQFLNKLSYTKILSLPHVIAVNNKKAQVIIGEERFVKDESVGNQGGTVTATKKWIEAKLVIDLLPRIAFGEEAENLSLDVTVHIDNFTDASITEANRNKRHVETTALLKSGDVLALGGLLQLRDTNSVNQTPILGQIPLLGYLFKQRKRDTPKTSLTVFIMPTIVHPKYRGGMGDYTRDYIQLTKDYTREGMLFDSLKDPITRWFFQPESRIAESIDTFVAEQRREEEYRQEINRQEVYSDMMAPSEEVRPKKRRKKKKSEAIAKSDATVQNESKYRKKSILEKRRRASILGNEHDDPLRSFLADQENPLLES